MREIRQSGSEGGGIGHTDPPYPYRSESLLRLVAGTRLAKMVGRTSVIAIFVSRLCMPPGLRRITPC